MKQPKEFTAKIIHIERPTTDIRLFRFCIQDPEGISFEAGQFFMLQFGYGGKRIERPYSVASPPTQLPQFDFCLKYLLQGKASNFLESKKVGDSVSFRGPLGFFLVNHEPRPLYLVATGTGIAPFRSMLYDELERKHSSRPIHFLFGVRHESDILYENELCNLASKYPQFSYAITLSQPSELWKGVEGRVTAHLQTLTLSNQLFYLCGSPPMVRDSRKILLEKGVSPKDIRFEIFT